MATNSVTLLLAAAALLGSLQANAATFVVNDTADVVDATPGDGVCETSTGNGTCTLRAAILEANALAGADTVTLPAGIYGITTGIPSMGSDTSAIADFDITADLEIAGAGPGVSIVEGNYEVSEGWDRAFEIAAGATVSISGVTIRRGSVATGAGIRNAGTLALSDCEIRENGAGFYPITIPGGGISNDGTATITRCDIAENSAWGDAGGIANAGTLDIDDSAVHGNRAVSGGGIVNGGTLNIRNSTIDGNTAHGLFSSALLVREGAGAGIFDTGGSAGLEHTTVSGNLVDSNLPVGGSFIPDYYGTGAGLGVANGVTTSGFTLRSTIVAGNTHDYGATDNDCGTPAPTSLGHNLDGDGTCMLTGTGDLPSTDPMLGPLADNGGPTPTRAVPAGSAAIDAADPDLCPAADQRGAPRPSEACDIGAYESTLPCGDGDVDAGEQCDDGNPAAGDCCSFLCQYEPINTVCELDGDPCTHDRCDGGGVCTLTTTTDCARCETCLGNACVPGPRAVCRNPFGNARSTLILKPDSLVWRWTKGEATSSGDFGDPTTIDDYGLCLFDHFVGPLEEVHTRIDATLPGGALCGAVPCWLGRGQPPGSRGFRYRDRQGTQAGIEKIVMRPGLDGQARILVKAQGPGIGFSEPLDLEVPAVLQLQRDDGACWEATFSDVVTYESDLVKLRSEAAP